jgi:hypothetical protein
MPYSTTKDESKSSSTISTKNLLQPALAITSSSCSTTSPIGVKATSSTFSIAKLMPNQATTFQKYIPEMCVAGDAVNGTKSTSSNITAV